MLIVIHIYFKDYGDAPKEKNEVVFFPSFWGTKLGKENHKNYAHGQKYYSIRVYIL